MPLWGGWRADAGGSISPRWRILETLGLEDAVGGDDILQALRGWSVGPVQFGNESTCKAWLTFRYRPKSINPRCPPRCGGCPSGRPKAEAAQAERQRRDLALQPVRLTWRNAPQQGRQRLPHGVVVASCELLCCRRRQCPQIVIRPGRRAHTQQQPGRLQIWHALKSAQKQVMAFAQRRQERGHEVCMAQRRPQQLFKP